MLPTLLCGNPAMCHLCHYLSCHSPPHTNATLSLSLHTPAHSSLHSLTSQSRQVSLPRRVAASGASPLLQQSLGALVDACCHLLQLLCHLLQPLSCRTPPLVQPICISIELCDAPLHLHTPQRLTLTCHESLPLPLHPQTLKLDLRPALLRTLHLCNAHARPGRSVQPAHGVMYGLYHMSDLLLG